MKKTNIIILKTISLISWAISAFFLIYGACLIFNIGGIRELYIEMMTTIGVIKAGADAQFEIYMAIFDCLVGIFLNSYCAGMYFKIAKANTILIGSSKMLMYMGILQCLFGISLLPGILAIVSSIMLSKTEKTIIERPREQSEASGIDYISEKIIQLKQQKERGEITEEQYNLAVNEILESSAKSQLNNENKK